MESDLTIPSISTSLRISWNCRVSLGWQWCKGSSLQFKCSICQCFTIEIEKTSPNLTTARQGGEFHWFEWRRRGDIPIRNQIPLTSHDPSSSPALPVLHLFDHTDHTNHDQMAATYKENQEPRNDLANQCLQLIIRHRLPKRKYPNNPINCQLGCYHDLIFTSIFRDGPRSTLRILLPGSPKWTSGNRTENWAKSLSQELWTWRRLHTNDFATNNYLHVSL